MRVPLTWQMIVVVPEIFVTQADSPRPISRTRWQKCVSPVRPHTRPAAPAWSWQRGVGAVVGSRFIGVARCARGDEVSRASSGQRCDSQKSAARGPRLIRAQ
jgi:hypothetical protein